LVSERAGNPYRQDCILEEDAIHCGFSTVQCLYHAPVAANAEVQSAKVPNKTVEVKKVPKKTVKSAKVPKKTVKSAKVPKKTVEVKKKVPDKTVEDRRVSSRSRIQTPTGNLGPCVYR
jgi:hypothetical protein